MSALFILGQIGVPFPALLRDPPALGGAIGGLEQPIVTTLCSEEERQRRKNSSQGTNNPFFGRKHSDEARKKIQEGLLKKDFRWRIENASRAGKSLKGYKRTNTESYSRASSQRPKYECPHCHKVGQYNSMIAWHGDNCKMRQK